MMRRVLIVSPHFPPVNAPDHQRVRQSLPFFAENGWSAEVLAVAPDATEVPLDPLLADSLPAGIPVHRVSAWNARLCRLLGFGNLAYRAWFPLRRAGDDLLRTGSFDLVYFSTTQFVVTALGSRWRRQFCVPFVVDVQDPWRTDYYERPGAPPPPGGAKYQFARWQAARLEPRAWRDASGFISVNADYLAQLAARYPWFSAHPSAVIPFGVSETDFDFVRGRTDLAPAFTREPGAIHLVNVGAVGPIMRAALAQLFAGVALLRQRSPSAATRLRFHFIGTSYAPAGRTEPSVAPLAEAAGVSDLVHESTGRIGYFSALATLLAADALVIPGSDDPAYQPSKIAVCFLAAKPTLAIAPAASALLTAVRALGFATTVATASGSASDEIVDFLQTRLAAGSPALPATRAEIAFTGTHTARARTAQQCALFARALSPI